MEAGADVDSAGADADSAGANADSDSEVADADSEVVWTEAAHAVEALSNSGVRTKASRFCSASRSTNT